MNGRRKKIQRPLFSVVICTLNRHTSLQRTLESLRDQKCDRLWEVVVIDNGSTRETAETVQQMIQSFPVRLILVTEPERGLARARNRALKEAGGDVVLFLDDDVTPHADLLRSYANAFGDLTVFGAGGPVRPVLPPDTPEWLRENLQGLSAGPAGCCDHGGEKREVGLGEAGLPIGGNMAVRRKAAIEYGGFRTDLGWGPNMLPGEETEFFERVLARGAKVVYLPAAVVDHHIHRDRLTLAYHLWWYRALGRASVVRNPPTSPGGMTIRAAKAFISLSLTSLRIGMRTAFVDRLALRDRVRRALAAGRLLSLLGW